MNDTGGGVTAIHDVPGDITRIGVQWMLLFSFLSLGGGGFYLFFTRSVSEVTDFLCPEFSNFRIFFLHTENRVDHVFSCPDFFLCPEFSNFRIFSSHGMSRRSRIFFVPRLVLGSTDRREVVRDFFSSHGVSRNNLFYHAVSNYRISFTRNVAEITDFFLSRDLSLDPLTNGR